MTIRLTRSRSVAIISLAALFLVAGGFKNTEKGTVHGTDAIPAGNSGGQAHFSATPLSTERANRRGKMSQTPTCERLPEKVQRYGSVIGVKPEKLDYYKKLHANPWPSVNKALKEAHIRNYSIYLTQFDDGKWYLFSYFEYTGSDFKADMEKVAQDAETKRWWKETDPCQIGLKNRKEGEWWKTMEEVYHLE